MSDTFRLLGEKFPDLDCNPTTDIVVEIGSGVGPGSEGSTEFLYSWAKQHGLAFYSIDINDAAKNILGNTDINFVIQSGHEWCRDVLPTIGKQIKVLYLDNFDYIWEPSVVNLKVWKNTVGVDFMFDLFEKQIKKYAERNIDLTRENSMEEHRLQAMYCLPYMSQQSVVLMDDTHGIPGNVYGKCATAIPLLVEAGYQLSPRSYQYAYRE